MSAIDFYATLKSTHVALALTSVALFAARGVGVLAGGRWPMTPTVRRASVAIDTLLIAAGGMLWWTLSLNPTRERWLLAKLVLIVLYIVLGSLALKRARRRATKAAAFVASLACVAMIASIALSHDPAVLCRWLAGTT